jgi:hypothetical protein
VVHDVASVIKGKANLEVFDLLVFDEVIEEEDGEIPRQ